METQNATVITVQSTVNVPVDKVWNYWTKPEYIVKWNNASDDWHTTSATADLRVGGSFTARMEAKDGSMGFDFAGVYDAVRTNEYIEYTLGDGRKVKIIFTANGKDDNNYLFAALFSFLSYDTCDTCYSYQKNAQ